jgi:ABC-type multidrug transport system fused ATPase/permease subunit
VEKCFNLKTLLKDRIIVMATHRPTLVHHLSAQFVHMQQGQVLVSMKSPFLQTSMLDLSLISNSYQMVNEENKQTGADISPEPFVEKELLQHGGIKARIFLKFIRSAKFWWFVLISALVMSRLLGVSEQWFFKSWSEAYDTYQSSLHTFRGSISLDPKDYLPNPNDNLTPWICLLLFVSICRALSLAFFCFSHLTAILVTTKVLYAETIRRIANATFRFYDTTTTGRLMNRVTSDVDVIGNAVNYLGNTVFSASFFVVSVVVIAFLSPLFLAFATVLMVFFVLLFHYFLPTSRSLKRMETAARSPLYSFFGELLGHNGTGLTTVRAFRAQKVFDQRICDIVDTFQAYGYYFWATQTWMTYRYDMISEVSTFLLAITAVAMGLSSGLTAFLLYNANAFILSAHGLCTRFGGLQTEFISIERIIEMMEIEQEDPGTQHPPAFWPRFGNASIEFKDVTIRYAQHLDPSLVNVSLTIPGGKTTVITGRTGSGKSTLASSLLKVVNPVIGEGLINIDNIPLTDLNVMDLRRRVTYVPQDPVLFPGTLRENLDPVAEYTDTECSVVLERVLSVAASQNSRRNSEWTLETHIETGGRNFSQGERQVIGIARAILKRSSVLILDEAFASVDGSTAAQLYALLKEELFGATIVMIAHRRDWEGSDGVDYEIVLEGGKVAYEGWVREGNWARRGGEQ